MFGRSILFASAVTVGALGFSAAANAQSAEPPPAEPLLSKPQRVTDPAEIPDMPAPKPRPKPELCLPANAGNLPKVQGLVKKGAALDATDSLGRTALMVALSRPEDAAIAADGKPKGKPLPDVERSARKLKVARFLVERGANVRARSEIGMSALHYAAMWPGQEQDALDMVRLLLSKGADVDARMETGITPLRLAVDHHRAQLVRFLIDAGADPQSKDDQEDTPWSRAHAMQSTELMEALRGRTPLPGAPAQSAAAKSSAAQGSAPSPKAAPAATPTKAPETKH